MNKLILTIGILLMASGAAYGCSDDAFHGCVFQLKYQNEPIVEKNRDANAVFVANITLSRLASSCKPNQIITQKHLISDLADVLLGAPNFDDRVAAAEAINCFFGISPKKVSNALTVEVRKKLSNIISDHSEKEKLENQINLILLNFDNTKKNNVVCSGSGFSGCVNGLIFYNELIKSEKSKDDVNGASFAYSVLRTLSNKCTADQLNSQENMIADLVRVLVFSPDVIKFEAMNALSCFFKLDSKLVQSKFPKEYHMRVYQLGQSCCNTRSSDQMDIKKYDDLFEQIQNIIQMIPSDVPVSKNSSDTSNTGKRVPASK